MSTKNVNKKFKKESSDKKPYSNCGKQEKSIICYWIFAVLRVLLTLLPQTGYIHPDEYFQSIEVIAGDRFDIDVFRPWEFNATFPLRSTLIPQLTIGIPYSILNIISPYFWYYFQINLRTPYYLTVLPRIFICLLSFITDYCLYKICRIHNQDFRSRLTIYASSYIMLVYSTRTLSNSIESILVALLIYYVSRCMILSKEIISRSDYILLHYDNAPNIIERIKYYKLRASIPGHSLNDCMIIGTITVIGIFNRPTFIAFGFTPIFFWLQRGLGTRSVGFMDFHVRIITFIVCTIPTSLLLILVDSFYFGYITLGEIINLDIGMKSFVVTPLNFLKYNSVTKNLASHGLHSRFLHFLVNVPLLFNVLGVIGIMMFIQLMYRVSKSRWLELPRSQSIESLMTGCFVIPIGLLSMFPHQEPRFIIPTLLPLVYLHAPTIEYGLKITTSACINPRVSNFDIRRNTKIINKLKWIWLMCNVILLVFYGFLHQGGVLPLARHLAKEIRAKPELMHIHLHTSYTYPLPTALLQLKNTRRIYTSSDEHRYKLKKDFFLYEHGSAKASDVYDALVIKLNQSQRQFVSEKIPYRIYYVAPVNFFNDFIEYTFVNDTKNVNFQIISVFYPHVTTERLPMINFNFIECLLIEKMKFCMENIGTNFLNDISRFFESFGLVLVRLQASNNNSIA